MEDHSGVAAEVVTRKAGSPPLAPTCWKKELLGATAQTGRAAQARLVAEHLGRA